MGIRLEAGKRYVTRNGWITPPICEDLEAELCGTMRFFSGDLSWSCEGRGLHMWEDDDDLISEFTVVAPVVNVPDDHEYLILAKMELYGGGFAKQLSIAYRLADSVNRQKIRNTFSDYWVRYAELAEVEVKLSNGDSL
jgi:hypothetical protein